MANFWSTPDVEPKRNFRFQVQITGLTGGDDVLWWAKTVTTPSFEVSEVEHNFLDNKYYYPGRVSWNEVSMTLVDPISIDAVEQTNQLLVDSGYIIPSGVPATELQKSTISKKGAAGAIGQVTISILKADGSVVEEWTLFSPFIRSAKYGDLDYSNDELKTVELTLRYDWATHTAADGTDYFKKA